MKKMFYRAYKFNQPIGDWDVSKVTNMRMTFDQAIKFNQPIGDWDVSNVIDMQGLFNYGLEFNQPLGDWNVSNVINMQDMFDTCVNFNQNIRGWIISSATGIITNYRGTHRMFVNATQMLANYGLYIEDGEPYSKAYSPKHSVLGHTNNRFFYYDT